MRKGQNKTGINPGEQDSEFVTIPRCEYDDLRQEVTDFAAAVRMWKGRFEKLQADFEILSKSCSSMAETNLWYVEQLYGDTGEPKNCKPYTGPKVVQMFPRPKSE